MKLFNDIWENGIISFDTCSLGRMYEWESYYAVDIKDALSYLLRVNKLWETIINVQEFSKQRKEIKDNIYDQKYVKGIFNNLEKRPIPWNKINGTLGRWEANGFSEKFKQELKKHINKKKITEEEYNYIKNLSKETTFLLDSENVFDQIIKDFSNDDLSLSNDEKNNLKSIYDSGKMCPGAKDYKKHNGNKYNDLYIWTLLKKKAKMENKSIIFVTTDTAKGDWFENNQLRVEYLNEFKDETGQELLALSLSDFWKKCKDYLDMPVDKFIELSSIKDQIDEKYNVFYEEEIFNGINSLLSESDEIKELLENEVDCCVDMPILNELVGTIIDEINVEEYDENSVYVSILLRTEASFEAVNHTAGEDWSAGKGTVSFSIVASAEIPVIWESEDTNRILLQIYCVFEADVV